MVTSLPFLEYAVRKHHEPTLTLTKPGNRNHSRKLKTREVTNPTWFEFDQVRFSQTSDAKFEKGLTKMKLLRIHKNFNEPTPPGGEKV